jgi:hypothetical protein
VASFDVRNSGFLDGTMFLLTGAGDSLTGVTFYGAMQYVGRTLTVYCTGLDCGDYVVQEDGSIIVPYLSDPDGLFTSARIIACSAEAKDWGPLATAIVISGVTYTVPAIAGFCYTSRGQGLRPLAQTDLKSQQGSGLGKMRRVHRIGALLNGTIGIYFGTDFNHMERADLRNPTTDAVLNSATMFSGVHWGLVEDSSSFDGMVCWEITRPFPATVVALTSYLDTSEP